MKRKPQKIIIPPGIILHRYPSGVVMGDISITYDPFTPLDEELKTIPDDPAELLFKLSRGMSLARKGSNIRQMIRYGNPDDRKTALAFQDMIDTTGYDPEDIKTYEGIIEDIVAENLRHGQDFLRHGAFLENRYYWPTLSMSNTHDSTTEAGAYRLIDGRGEYGQAAVIFHDLAGRAAGLPKAKFYNDMYDLCIGIKEAGHRSTDLDEFVREEQRRFKGNGFSPAERAIYRHVLEHAIENHETMD